MILGIDYGPKKLGIAIADEASGSTNIIDSESYKDNSDLDEIFNRLHQEWSFDEVVVGVPYSETGQISTKGTKIVKIVKSAITRLNKELEVANIELKTYPEDFSTKISNQGLSRKEKQTIGDSVAAEYILKKYLEWQNEFL